MVKKDESPSLASLGPQTRVRDDGDVAPTGGGDLVGPIFGFEGLSSADNAAARIRVDDPPEVPDAVGDIGTSHYVQWVNGSLAVYDKRGLRLLGPVAGNRIWAGFGGLCERTNRGDPIVLYDELAGRWLLSQFAWRNDYRGDPVAPFLQCIAVSTTPDPLGAYYRYAFQMPGDAMNDYPKLAVWPNGYYMADFPTTKREGARGTRARASVFDRAQMLVGADAGGVSFDLGDDFLRMLPADVDGSTGPDDDAPGYFVNVVDSCERDDGACAYDRDRIEVWRLAPDFAVPARSVFSGQTTIEVEPFTPSVCATPRKCVPQPAPGTNVDELSSRLMFRVGYRQRGSTGSLVLNHTVRFNGHAAIRWYQLRDDAGVATLVHSGTYAPDAASRWMASIAEDASGNIGLGFNTSSSTSWPSLGYAGWSTSDPLGALGHEGRLATGRGAQTGTSRWGDYSSLSVDPSDGCTFWYTGEYYAATSKNSWRTRIGAFKFPTCGPMPLILGRATEGTLLVVDPADLDARTFEWRRCDANGNSCRRIKDAETQTYTAWAADVGATLRVAVTATRATGAVVFLSVPSARVEGPPRDVKVALTATVERTPSARGQLTYRAAVGNGGDGTATAVRLGVTVPAGSVRVRARTSRGSCDGGIRVVICEIPTLDPAAGATVDVVVVVERSGTVAAEAFVTADQTDIDPSNNRAAVTSVVTGPPRLTRAGPPFVLRRRGTFFVGATRIRVDGEADVQASITNARGRTGVRFAKGSELGTTAASGPTRQLTYRTARSQVFRVAVRVRANALVPRQRYSIVLRATDSRAASSRFVLPLRLAR